MFEVESEGIEPLGHPPCVLFGHLFYRQAQGTPSMMEGVPVYGIADVVILLSPYVVA